MSSWCYSCTHLTISCHVFDLVLTGIELTGLFSFSCTSGVSKLANDINSSSMASSLVSSIASSGNGSIGSTCMVVVSGSIAKRITDLQIIFQL